MQLDVDPTVAMVMYAVGIPIMLLVIALEAGDLRCHTLSTPDCGV